VKVGENVANPRYPTESREVRVCSGSMWDNPRFRPGRAYRSRASPTVRSGCRPRCWPSELLRARAGGRIGVLRSTIWGS